MRLPRAALEQFAEAAACMMYDMPFSQQIVKNQPSKLRSSTSWHCLSKFRTSLSGHPAPEQVQKQQQLASPVTRILSLSAPALRLLTSCMTRLMTLKLKPPASQLFMKPTCTIGRVQQKVWPLLGGGSPSKPVITHTSHNCTYVNCYVSHTSVMSVANWCL